MEKIAQKMIGEGTLCVLSTCFEDDPNTSLMQYISNETCNKIYMITLESSTKYHNLIRNPRVSLLIDTRDKLSSEDELIKSLILYGNGKIIDDAETENDILKRFVIKHRNLIPLTENKDCRIIEVSAEKMLLLNGVDEAQYLEV